MIRNAIFVVLMIFMAKVGIAQQNGFGKNIDFNGYIQIRGTSNFDDYTGISVRRLKLWVKSTPEFSKHWSYKIQTTFSSFLQEKFFSRKFCHHYINYNQLLLRSSSFEWQ